MIFDKIIFNMYRLRALILALLAVSVFSSVTVRVGETSQLISETELSKYLSTMVGFNHQSIQMTPQLRKIANTLRLSVLNPVDKITVLLVIDNNISEMSERKVELSQELSQILPTFSNKLAFSIIRGSEETTVQQQIQKYTSSRSVVVIIRESQSQINKLNTLFQTKGSSAKRRLNEKQMNQQTTPDDTEFYLIKFFFSLLFIIVIIGIVSQIASNDGKKDTLLYAKFIADVSNSR